MKLEKSLLGDRPIVETMLAKEMVEAFDIILAVMKDRLQHGHGNHTIATMQDLEKLRKWRNELPEECEYCGKKGEDLPCWCFDY